MEEHFRHDVVMVRYDGETLKLAYPQPIEDRLKIWLSGAGVIWLNPAITVLPATNGAPPVLEVHLKAGQVAEVGRLLIAQLAKVGLYEQHQHVQATGWGRTKIFVNV